MRVEREVHKYVVRPWTIFNPVREGAQLLHVAGQGDDVCVWALVDPEAPLVERKLFIIPTGSGLLTAEGAEYVGTAHLPGPLVFHVFDGGVS